MKKNVVKIMDLLKEINMLINDSGQIIDEIERKQRAAKILTEKGVKNLVEAKENHQEAKKVGLAHHTETMVDVHMWPHGACYCWESDSPNYTK